MLQKDFVNNRKNLNSVATPSRNMSAWSLRSQMISLNNLHFDKLESQYDTPKYVGKYCPEFFYEECLGEKYGTEFYVFEFPLWQTLCYYRDFHGHCDGKFIRKVTRWNEFLLVSQKGIFLVTRSIRHDNFYTQRGEDTEWSTFIFVDFDESKSIWNFELESSVSSRYLYFMSCAFSFRDLDMIFPCPQNILLQLKLTFGEFWMNPILSDSVAPSEDQVEFVKIVTRGDLKSIRKSENAFLFRFKGLKEEGSQIKCYQMFSSKISWLTAEFDNGLLTKNYLLFKSLPEVNEYGELERKIALMKYYPELGPFEYYYYFYVADLGEYFQEMKFRRQT